MMAKVKKAVSRAGVYLVLIAASIVSIFPCYFMFVSAFMRKIATSASGLLAMTIRGPVPF